MYLHYYLPPVILALALGLVSPIRAAQPLSLQTTSYDTLKQQFSLRLPGHTVQSVAHTPNSLALVGQHKDARQVTHLRFAQHYAGFLVFGGYAILHNPSNTQTLLQNNASIPMTGVVYNGLQDELGQPSPTFVANASLALQAFKKNYPNKALSQETVTPLIYLDAYHKAHWAYKVSVYLSADKAIPQRPTAILDAETYKPFVVWDTIKTQAANKLESVFGIGFGGNEKMGLYQYGKDLPLLQLTRNAAKSLCYMANKEVRVVDMEHNYTASKNPMKFECKESALGESNAYYTGYASDGYDKENGAASPTNDALYAGYVIKHLYKEWYGLETLTDAGGAPMQLIMRVHYGEGYENAYWDGKQMTFGDGETMMYPLVSLGVGAHEISHGFTEQHAGLEYFGHSGGMNESFSDMAAQAAEYYSTGKNSWQIGGEIMKKDSGFEALRYMDKPSRDGMSIDSASQYHNGLDVHYSSGVYNHLFYILATKKDWDVKRAFDIVVKANLDYWTPYSSFEEGGCGMLHAAKDLGYSLEEVKSALTQVAIRYDACNIGGDPQ